MPVKAGKSKPVTPIVESPPLDEREELELELGQESELPIKVIETGGFKTVDAKEKKPLLPFPAKVIKSEHSDTYFEWMAKLDDEDWLHLSTYIYRTWPLIERQQVDPKAYSYIDCPSGKFTKEDILADHGSGEYKITINDLNKTVAGKGGQIGTVFLTLNERDHPPKLILEELLIDHPKNRRYVDKLKAEGKLTNDGRVMTPQPNTGGNDQAAMYRLVNDLVNKVTSTNQSKPDSTVETVTSMLSKTHDQSLAMIREQMKGDDPDKLLKTLTLLMTLMQGNKTEDKGESLLATVLKIQNDAQTRTDSMMTKMMEMMQVNKGGIKDEVETLLAIKEAFGGGEGPAAKKTTVEVVTEAVAPLVGKVLDVITGVMSMKNFEAGLKARQTTQVPTTVPAATTEQQPQGENVVEMPASGNQQLVAMIKGPAGPMIIGALQRGQTGSAFAEGVENMLGPLVYKQIIAVSKPAMLEAMKAVPEFAEALVQVGATDQIVAEFIDDFFAYNEGDGEGEEGA